MNVDEMVREKVEQRFRERADKVARRTFYPDDSKTFVFREALSWVLAETIWEIAPGCRDAEECADRIMSTGVANAVIADALNNTMDCESETMIRQIVESIGETK